MAWLDQLDIRWPKFAFARHIPPRQLAYRVRQRLRRKLLGPAHGRHHPDCRLVPPQQLPQPIFPPRAIEAGRTASGWRFHFVGKTHECGPMIDWSAPGPGPADQLWRMNLHYMEYLEVLDFASGLEAIEQWIAGNPVNRPGALSDAWNSYALSLRLHCWLQWLARHGADVPAEAGRRLASSLLQQGAFLEANLELDIGGNHLFKNIKALIALGQATTGPDAQRWLARGLELLRAELDRQILNDGVHFELSPSYHCQVTADLLEILSILPDTLGQPFRQTAAAMVSAAILLAHPDGRSAQFNDAGLTMAYPPGQIAAAASALGLSVGQDATGPRLLEASGYLVWQDAPGNRLIVKGGPIGADTLPAHAHGDHGSFELSLSGQRFIVDQGVNIYVASSDRHQSRTSSAHNVTCVEGADQARFFGDFRVGWRTRPSVGTLARADAGHSFVSQCQLASPQGLCATVDRRMTFAPGRLDIADQVKTVQSIPAHCTMLVHPDVTIAVEESAVHLAFGTVKLIINGPAPPKIVDAVWWPDMGHSIRTRRLVWDFLPEIGTLALSLIWNSESHQ